MCPLLPHCPAFVVSADPAFQVYLQHHEVDPVRFA